MQSHISDAKLLQDLAAKARALKDAPAIKLTYSVDPNGILRSFSPRTQAQGAKGAGVETKSVGVDPRKKKAEVHKANNATTGVVATR